MPICHTCNSKAKLAKDLLHKNGLRRLSFSPWTESALPGELRVVATAGHVDHGKSSLIVRLTGMDPDRWAEEA